MSVPSYTLTTADVVSVDEALEFFGGRLGSTRRHHDPEGIGNADIRVTAWIDPAPEFPELADYLRLEDMLLVIMRPSKRLDPDRSSAVLAEFIAACAAFLEAHPGTRAVVHEDASNRVIMRSLDDGRIELDEYLLEPANAARSGRARLRPSRHARAQGRS